MNTTTYLNFRDSALEHLHKGQLLDALTSIEGQINFSGQLELRDRLITLREDYRLLLSYYKRGVNDPTRHGQRQQLLARAFELSQLLHHHRQMQGDTYRALTHRLAMGEREEREQLLRVLQEEHQYEDIFNVVWSSYGWSADIDAAATAFLLDGAQPYHRKTSLVAALMLSILSTFEAARLSWMVSMLINIVDTPLYDRLLTAVVFATIHHAESLALYPELARRIKNLFFDQRYATRIRELQQLLVGVLETQRFTQKMQTEIMPQMEKATQNLPLPENMEEMVELAQTPEHKEFAQTMIAVFQMHVRGVDTSYLAFQRLAERERFFRHAAHWFGAYEPTHPEVQACKAEHEMLNFVLQSKSSDTDRLGTLKLFETAQQLAAQHRASQEEEGAEAEEKEASPALEDALPKLPPQFVFEVQEEQDSAEPQTLEEKMAEQVAQQRKEDRQNLLGYLHDLYRYFHLFVHRHEGENPFRDNLLLLEHPLFAKVFAEERSIVRLAKACYALEQYATALALMQRLPETEKSLRFIAHCQYHLGERENCVESCLRLLQMKSDDEETLRMLIALYLRLQQEEEALVHLIHLESLLPDDLDLVLRTGLAFMRMGLYEDGLERMYKILYHEPERRDAKVCLGWALLNLRRLDEAEPILMALLNDQPTDNDYFNAAHLAWLRGDISAAAMLYAEALKLKEQTYAPADFFATDEKELRQLGFADEDFALMLDLINAAI